jgi:hypothetical protein
LSRDFSNLRDPFAASTLVDMKRALTMAKAGRAVAAAGAMLLAALATACAAPATVEGVFGGDSFRLESTTPLTKPTASGRDMVVVLSQVESETLRTVTLVLPHVASLPLGKPLDVGTGAYGDERPSLEVAVGDLLVETRADGVEIISATDAVIAATTGGTFTLDDRSAEGDIAGTFDVELDDGGYLQGTFVATPESR